MFYFNATHEATACREESWAYHYDDGLGGRILFQQTNPYASFNSRFSAVNGLSTCRAH
jgi:hypothetical protein